MVYTKRMNPPLTMIGSCIATVEQSKNTKYPKGSSVISLAGWVDRAVINPDEVSHGIESGFTTKFELCQKLCFNYPKMKHILHLPTGFYSDY